MSRLHRWPRLMMRVRCSAMACCVARTASAQSPLLKSDDGPFLRHSDAIFIGGALAAAALTSFLDAHVATELTEPGIDGTALHRFSVIGNTIGGPGPLALSAALFATGHLTRHSDLTNLGKWGVEAVAVSGVTTALLKGLVGRKRPSAASGDVDIYRIGHGFGNNTFASFPSGHTSAAFAVATVLARGTAHNAPLTHRAVTAVAYGAAAAVGLSRMYENQHWASDVVAGAAIGITSGLAVVRRGRRSSGATQGLHVESVLSRISVAPAERHGFMISYQAR